MMFVRWCMHGLLLFLAFPCARAQDALAPDPTAQSTTALPPPSVSEKWNFFVNETVTPLTPVAVALNATVSQLTRSAPLYGKHFWRREAFLKRFGATLGDEVSQIFLQTTCLRQRFTKTRGTFEKVLRAKFGRALVMRSAGR